jgi:stearoyl-CoA desaturase (delta-9 desaturase)
VATSQILASDGAAPAAIVMDTKPSSGDAPPARQRPVGLIERVVTVLLVIGPFVAVGWAAIHFWGEGVSLLDLVLLVVFYVITALGITVGFHRLLTHRSFEASRPLRLALAVVGSLAFQGGPIGWVAGHRRHHALADRPGDPHSPHVMPGEPTTPLRAFVHGHIGWLFGSTTISAPRYAADLLGERDMVRIDRLFPVFTLLSLALPAAIGYALGGPHAALTAMLWAGGVRIFLVQHVTWSINSVCHVWGRRPFSTRDRSTNVSWLAIPSFGESWHNGHHAYPRSARHGLLPGQVDLSAALIRLFERWGWAHEVVWPNHVDDGDPATATFVSRDECGRTAEPV